MKKLIFFLFLVFLPGCARLRVETKEPIRVDINMRLDVYQHVVEDVRSIEEQIYGNRKRKINYLFGASPVYAASQVEEAIKQRRQRVEVIENYLGRGYVGENRKAYLEVIEDNVSPEVKRIVEKENKDRSLIYRDVARRNNAPLAETKKVFFKNHYQRAPSGWHFEIYDSSKGAYTWVKK